MVRSSFAVQIGNHAQVVRVFPSTAGYTTWAVMPAGCPDFYPSSCPDDRGKLFDSNNSLTWVPKSTYDLGLEQNLDLDSSGEFGSDTVTLGWAGSGGPTYSHAVVAEYADPRYWIGMFGLKPLPTNFSDMASPQLSFMQYLKNSSQIPSTSYGYTAGNQYRLKAVFGSLTLGGYDVSRFNSSQNITMGMYTDISRDLLIGVQGVTISGQTSSWTSGMYAYIDSTVSEMWLPVDLCQQFEAAFGLTYNSNASATTIGSGYYFMNASLHARNLQANKAVTFTLGAQSAGGSTIQITFPYSAFALNMSWPVDINNQSSYQSSLYFPLKQATSDTQYTLGRTFLQEAYVIADYDSSTFTVAPCTWQSNMTAQIHAVLPPGADQSKSSSSSSFPAGAIAGVVVGVVVLVALIGLAIFLVRRRRSNARRRNEASRLEAEKRQAEVDAHESKPFIAAGPAPHDASNELDGSDGAAIHELGMPKFDFGRSAEMDSQENLAHKPGYNEMEGEGNMSNFGNKEPRFGTSEMEGHTPVYEMPGSEVHEMPTGYHLEKGIDALGDVKR